MVKNTVKNYCFTAVIRNEIRYVFLVPNVMVTLRFETLTEVE